MCELIVEEEESQIKALRKTGEEVDASMIAGVNSEQSAFYKICLESGVEK